MRSLSLNTVLFVVLFVGCLFSPMAHAEDKPLPLTIPITRQVMSRYLMVLDAFDGNPLAVDSLAGLNTIRAVAELVILLQALDVGGLTVEPTFLDMPNPARLRECIRSGSAVVSANTFFSVAIGGGLLKSSTMVPKGAFVKGVYTCEGNALLDKVRTLDALRTFRAVSSKTWVADWLTLSQMQLRELRSVPNRSLMCSLLADRRVDFLLLEFPPSRDLSLVRDCLALHPVQGIKVGIPDSRHYIVSKKHPDGRRVFDALERGLAVLRERGVIDRFYRQAGLYNPAVADWKLLNPDQALLSSADIP